MTTPKVERPPRDDQAYNSEGDSPYEQSLLRRLLEGKFIYVIEVVAILAFWELLASILGIIDPRFLPPPSVWLESLFELLGSTRFRRHMAFSAQNFIIGYALGVTVGILLGVAFGGILLLKFFVAPYVWVAYAIPRVAMAPVIVLWLGLGMSSKIAVIFLVVIFPVLINTMEGMRTVPVSLQWAGQVYGARGFMLARKVILPAIAPLVLVGMRVGVVRGWGGVVVSEILGSALGLGVLLSRATFSFVMQDAIAIVIVLIALANGSLGIFTLVQRKFLPWHEESYAPGG